MKGRDLIPKRPDTRPMCEECQFWHETNPSFLGYCDKGGDRDLGVLMFEWDGRGCQKQKLNLPV